MDLSERDYALIAEYLAKHFAESELAALGGLDRPFDRELRVLLSAKAPQFFCRYYLAEHFDVQPAPFHEDVWADVMYMLQAPGLQHLLEMLPRGTGKTTLLTFGFVLWCVCLAQRHFINIISAAQYQALNQLANIKAELESNKRLRDDFGNLVGKQRWTTTEIETANNVKVSAFGTNSQVRGQLFRQWRPDLIILDDVEDSLSVRSPTERIKLRDWVMSDVMRAGWRDTKVIAVGNPLHFDCLLMHLKKNPTWRWRKEAVIHQWHEADAQPLWDEWRRILLDGTREDRRNDAHAFFQQHKGAMLAGTQVAWPEVYPYEKLMVILASDGSASFNTELMCEPVDPGSRFFSHIGKYRRMWNWNGQSEDVWLVPWDEEKQRELGGWTAVPLGACRLFAATDPSMGQSTTGDYSAIIIIAKAPTGQMFVLEADIQRRTPDRIIRDQMTWFQRYPQVEAWAIESVAFQAFFADEAYRQTVMQLGRDLPRVPISAPTNNKDLRIEVLQPKFENDLLLLSVQGQELMWQQLENYPSDYKDGPDALEMAVRIAQDASIGPGSNVTVAAPHRYGEPEFMEGTGGNTQHNPYAEYFEMQRQRELAQERQRRREEAIKKGQDPDEIEQPDVFPIMFF